MMNKKINQNLQLYLHIPFCVQKCAYCDFLSSPASEQEIERYVQALVIEIKSYRHQYENYEVSTVFLGGGTPSILTEKQIEGVFSALYESFRIRKDAEISIEMNPGTVTKENLLTYKKLGINRLSIGLQSANDEELKFLGRIHTMQQFMDTYQMAREAGFHNINVDLISAIPGQTPESWIRTLKTVTDLRPEHISAYSLIVEEGTPFYEIYGDENKLTNTSFKEQTPKLPDENDERIIYKETKEFLEGLAYNRYEISNYAQIGYECRHNIGYWRRENYLGIGLGAASMIQNQRFSHISKRDEYISCMFHKQFDGIVVEKEELTQKSQMEEFMFLGLRMMQGVSKNEFFHLYGKKMDEIYESQIKKLIQEKLLEQHEDWVQLTEYGIDISNYVLSQFLL